VALGRAAARIDQRFKDQPIIEAAIRTTIGNSYNKLFEYRLAMPHLQRAVELRTIHLGEDHASTLDSMRMLANGFTWLGQFRDAAALHKKIAETQSATLGPDHPMTLRSIGALADALDVAGLQNLDATVRSLEQLLAKQRAICGPTHSNTLSTMQRLANDYFWAGRFADSIKLHEELLPHLTSQFGPKNRDTIWCLICFAYACQEAGKLEQAERLLGEALRYSQSREDSRNRRLSEANICGWLARTMVLQKRYEDAEPLAQKAVASFEKLQPDSERRFYWLSLLGAVYMGQRQFAKAEPLLLQGYEGMKEREALFPSGKRSRFPEVAERVVRFYEVAEQPENARMWQEKLAGSSPGRGERE
jgi:tetratricopeptide (TPR) repeat protein